MEGLWSRGRDDLYGVFPENLLMTFIHHQCPAGRPPGGISVACQRADLDPTPTLSTRRALNPHCPRISSSPNLAPQLRHPRSGPGGQLTSWTGVQPPGLSPSHCRSGVRLEATNLSGLSLGKAEFAVLEKKFIYPFGIQADSFPPTPYLWAPGCGSSLFKVKALIKPVSGWPR